MPIFLRQEVTSRLVHELHGGFEGLAAAWEEAADQRPDFPRAKQRATIYRWLPYGVPVKKYNFFSLRRNPVLDLQIFAFCSLIDVDIMSIFDFHRNGYFSQFAKIRRLIALGHQALDEYAPLLAMFAPAETWPSNDISSLCYGRNWFSYEFTNVDEWRSLDYILLKINFLRAPASNPRAVHIAYRRAKTRDTMWRYYGTVIAIDGRLELYNEGGDFQSMPQRSIEEIVFRTYYGGRPVEWRIASIHEFSIELEYPFNDMSVIGFNW